MSSLGTALPSGRCAERSVGVCVIRGMERGRERKSEREAGRVGRRGGGGWGGSRDVNTRSCRLAGGVGGTAALEHRKGKKLSNP